MGIIDWLPMSPLMGPPLPRFLGVMWPWLDASALPTSLSGESHYDNEEQWRWTDYTGRERVITVTRHAKRS